MGIVFDDASFRPRAPQIERIRTAMEEICGLEVDVFDDSDDADLAELGYDLRARLAFKLRVEPGHDSQQCGFAGTIEAEDADFCARKKA